MLQTSKYKSQIPTPPTGSVWSFQTVQTLIGLAFAIPLDYFNAELYLRKALNFNSENGMGLALAIAALVSQLVMLPGMNGLIRAREEQKVGQPIHHPAPGELASEDDRMLFLYKLRAFENVVEWLPVFIIHAVALVALGKTGTCVLLCVPYTIGKFMFTYGYGSGDSDRRIPGLIERLFGFVGDAWHLHYCRGATLYRIRPVNET